MTEPDPDIDLPDIFERWLASEQKIRVLTFFHDNPGVIETHSGLATRLGMSEEALEEALADQIDVGLIKQRSVGGQTILMFDREGEARMQQDVIDRLRRHFEERGAS